MQATAGFSWRPAPPRPHRHVEAGARRPMNSPAAATGTLRCESGGGRMFVFGLGFVGRYVSDRLKSEGWEIAGTCRSDTKKRELKGMGLDAYIFDVHKSKLESLLTLQGASHLLVSIPPIEGVGDPLLHLHKDIENTLSSGDLKWLGYMSSTSVYGDCGGALVSEEYPVNPKTESAKSRFAAERGWLDLGKKLRVPAYIFRLGGIYGPGRSALDTILNQKSMSPKQTMRKSKLYTARIHVADIYQAIKASFVVPGSGGIYNVVDDDPTPRAEVFSFTKAMIQSRWPDLIDQFKEGDAAEFASHVEMVEMVRGEKLVSNARLKEQLGVELLYPSYKLGLQHILDCYSVERGGR